VIVPSLVWPRGHTVQRFLDDTWQRHSLKMPAALSTFRSPLPPDELAGLACEEGVESRLVFHKADQWTLQHGPFSETQLQDLATTDWTLLVQDVEKHLPELARILDPFRFIPSWRMDDLMISCASPGGSVGPHVDAYDVFLIQAQGRRRWQWDSARRDYQTREDSELSLVRNFTPDQEWITEQGDVLYLPPGVAHFGVAMPDDELCMTYSVGFRAPSLSEMLQDLSIFLSDTSDPRYSDPDLGTDQTRDGLISPAAIARVRNMLASVASLDDRTLARWFGSLVTEPKAWLKPLPGDEPLGPSQVIEALASGAVLRRHGMALWARWQSPEQALLFVDGKPIPITQDLFGLAQRLCGHEELTITAEELRASVAAARVVTDLINEGGLEFDDDR
jgi:50S ribosomal protein L16 3-hydroxylase